MILLVSRNLPDKAFGTNLPFWILPIYSPHRIGKIDSRILSPTFTLLTARIFPSCSRRVIPSCAFQSQSLHRKIRRDVFDLSTKVLLFHHLLFSLSSSLRESVFLILVTKNHPVLSICGQNFFWNVISNVHGYFSFIASITHSFSRRFSEQVEYIISPQIFSA